VPAGYRPYGQTSGEGAVTVLTTVSGVDVYALPTSALIFQVYDARTGGAHITTLKDSDGTTTITQITVNGTPGNNTRGRILRFYAPDTLTEVWLDDGSGGPRIQVLPADVGVIPLTGTTVTVSTIGGAGTAGRALMAAETVDNALDAIGAASDADLAAATLGVVKTYDGVSGRSLEVGTSPPGAGAGQVADSVYLLKS
jgi:hypothetical protein